MTDGQLDAKFHALVAPVLGATQSEALRAACRDLGQAADVRALVEAARPRKS